MAAVLLITAACSDSGSQAQPGKIGSVLQDAPLNALDGAVGGESNRLSTLRGTPLVVNLWATWCAPCRTEMDSLERLSRSFAPNRLRVIGISVDEDASLARQFLRASGVSFANFHDPGQDLRRNVFGATAIPLTLVVDAQGKVVQRVLGARDWHSAQSLALIEDSLGMTLR